MSNSLVVGPVDTATPFSGAGLLDSGTQLAEAISSGSWIEGGIGAVSVAVDTAATVVDPLGSLIAAGLGWLMDHFEPLKGWLNDFTGDAGEVQGFAQTWSNIAAQMNGAGDELTRVLGDVDELAGEAIDAYRRFQADAAAHLHGAGQWAGAISTGLQIASTIVQVIHDLVRDTIAQLVGSAISWAAEAALTLGLATPLIVTQISTRVASLSAKVGTYVTKVIDAVRNLAKQLDQLKALFSKLSDLLEKTLKNAHPHIESVAALPGIRRLDPRRNQLIHDLQKWADDAEIPGYRPFGDLSGQKFLDTHLTGFTERGFPDWRWPADNGFAGPREPHGLLVHDRIDRISVADMDGDYASPIGAGFSERALPPDRLSPSFETTSYTVIDELPPEVVKGPIAGAFEQAGGGVQYYFPKGINWYVRNGYLE